MNLSLDSRALFPSSDPTELFWSHQLYYLIVSILVFKNFIIGHVPWETIFPIGSANNVFFCLIDMLEQCDKLEFDKYSDQSASCSTSCPYVQSDGLVYFNTLVVCSDELSFTDYQKQVSLTLLLYVHCRFHEPNVVFYLFNYWLYRFLSVTSWVTVVYMKE